ncbi:MAG: dienelactone hydrolase family protein [Myxococcaceae bacterium]
MKTPTFIAALTLLASTTAFAGITQKKVAYELDKVKFEGVLVYEEGGKPKPGLVLVPNWLGINEANLKQAELVAARGYTVFVADMYGITGRPKSMEEAGKAAGAVKGDRKLMRARVKKALEVFLAQKGLPLDDKKIGAIGFCFGGTSALELARSGAKILGVVSFHGGLGSPTPDDAKNITARVLALHGADDPNVPPDEVASFESEMRNAKIDWQLVAYGNAVHSFTDPDANMPGRAQYNEKVATRAYAAMDFFFTETFAAK